MRIRRKLAYAALATTLVACFDDVETDPEPDGSEPEVTTPTPKPDGGTTIGYDAGDEPGEYADASTDGPVAQSPSRGAPVALTADDRFAVVVNRDVGSVSVLSLSHDEKAGYQGQTLLKEISFGPGSEPWQVVIGPDDDTAYVVLRRDQKLAKIGHIRSYPELIGKVPTGSEPTSLALNPTGSKVYVTNWNDGTLGVFETSTLKTLPAIDLNGPLVDTGYLGKVTARPALAHPRSVTITNDRDGDDSDETIFVTEYFAQQVSELQKDGLNADINKTGIVYRISAGDHSVSTIPLAAIADIGFKDTAGRPAGCYPNQLQSITLNGDFAYVVSICAAPEGPEGIKVTTKACESVTDCATDAEGKPLNLIDPVCDVVANGKAKVCQDVANFKTATSPALHVIDIKNGCELAGAATNLNASFNDFFVKNKVATKKFPLVANDLAFVPGKNVGYVTANGIDAVFRVVFDASGKLSEVGSSTSPFINLFPTGKGPLGIAVGAFERKFAVVPNLTTRNLVAVDFNTQAIAGGASAPIATLTAALPPKGSDEEHILLGKDLFNTGRARWSLNGEGWGACQSCHTDGLTDNVTWFFGRGPRQSTDLSGSFASKNPNDQRLLNHTINRDEFHDFELNTRNTSGGAGAIVFQVSQPPQNVDRIDTAGLKIAELDGSSAQAADITNPLGLGFDATGKIAVGELKRNPMAKPAGSVLEDWANINRYAQTIRSPRSPSNLDKNKVYAGEQLFMHDGSCAGCHGGDKWTVSKLFYTPGIETMAALKVTDFAVPTGFPSALLPAEDPIDFKLVLNAGGDSVQCGMRNVKTFSNAESGVGAAELRNDMTTPAQGGGNVARPNADGDNNAANDPKANIGYNVPSLLGVASGAPYLHAGGARTLEALLQEQFKGHHQALAPNFLIENDPKVAARQIDELVHYLLSIDEDKSPLSLPKPGAQGGSLCPDDFVPPAPK